MNLFELDGYTFLLSVFIIFGLCIISGLIYHIISLNEELKEEIINIENKIPKCPECPKCDLKCPKCELKCPDCPKVPENKECPKCSDGTKQCPTCEECPEINCPSVDEIVTGVFPGRNTKVMGDDRYADVNPANSYDGLSTTNFYEEKYKFPMDSILNPGSPIRTYNKEFDSELLNNSDENYRINGSDSVSLSG